MEDTSWDYSHQGQRQQNRTNKKERTIRDAQRWIYKEDRSTEFQGHMSIILILPIPVAGQLCRQHIPVTFQFPLQTLLAGTSISVVRCMYSTPEHLFSCRSFMMSFTTKYFPADWHVGLDFLILLWQYLPLCETQLVGKAERHPFVLPFLIWTVVYWDGIQKNSKLPSMTSYLNQHLPTNLLKHRGV